MSMREANKIAIISPNGNYFNKNYLGEVLNAVVYPLSAKSVLEDHLLLLGYESLNWYSKLKTKNFKTVAVIFSDTLFCVNYQWCNEYAYNNNVFVYAMPDLKDYLFIPYVPAYQPIAYQGIKFEKPVNKIVICHSPQSKKYKENIKGSIEIEKAINELSKLYYVEYEVLRGLDYNECIKRKSKAHVFIDQLVKGNNHINQKRFGEISYKGGLGKSGIEAMYLGCCTITTMDEPITEPYFPPPPVILTTFDTFVNDLERVVVDTEYRMATAAKQSEWVKKYCSPEFVIMNMKRHIK